KFGINSVAAERHLATPWFEASAGDGDAQRQRRRDARRSDQSNGLAAAHDTRRADRAAQARVLDRTVTQAGRCIALSHRSTTCFESCVTYGSRPSTNSAGAPAG